MDSVMGDPLYLVAARCGIKRDPRTDLYERIQKSFPCGLISRSFFNGMPVSLGRMSL